MGRPRILASLLVPAVLLIGSCASNTTGPDSANADPMNAKAEVSGRSIDRGYDRDDWDQAALDQALAVAQQVANTPIGCNNPITSDWAAVLADHRRVALPMPGATVECESADGENLTFEAFVDDEHKLDFLLAKGELICERGKQAGLDPGGETTAFDGLPYVDGGTLIIEPDTAAMRDQLAQALGFSAGNMCTGVTDNAPAPQP